MIGLNDFYFCKIIKKVMFLKFEGFSMVFSKIFFIFFLLNQNENCLLLLSNNMFSDTKMYFKEILFNRFLEKCTKMTYYSENMSKNI